MMLTSTIIMTTAFSVTAMAARAAIAPPVQDTPSAPAKAQPEIIIGAILYDAASNMASTDIRILNAGETEETFALPDRMEAEILSRGQTRKIWLTRAAQSPARITIAPNGFARARYQLSLTDSIDPANAIMSIPAWSPQRVMMAAAPNPPAALASSSAGMKRAAETNGLTRGLRQDDALLAGGPSPSSIAATKADAASVDALPSDAPLASPPPSDRAAGNAFSDNLDVYEPIYAVYGPGTNTEARIQISFKYRLFGSRQQQGLPSSWRDGLHLAYTQRMFWDLGADSFPFRNVDYQPEIFYLTPSATYANGISVAGQIGLRHESNGRADRESRGINSLYFAPMATLPVTGLPIVDGYRLTIAPRLSLRVGSISDNPDIVRYRGSSALYLELGKDDGLRLSSSGRFNFSSGKGAASFDLSYPLARILGGGPDLYLFGQSFVGYGENLLDYNRHVTRFRVGLAIIR